MSSSTPNWVFTDLALMFKGWDRVCMSSKTFKWQFHVSAHLLDSSVTVMLSVLSWSFSCVASAMCSFPAWRYDLSPEFFHLNIQPQPVPAAPVENTKRSLPIMQLQSSEILNGSFYTASVNNEICQQSPPSPPSPLYFFSCSETSRGRWMPNIFCERPFGKINYRDML